MNAREAATSLQVVPPVNGEDPRSPVATAELVRSLLRRMATGRGRQFQIDSERLLDVLGRPDRGGFHDSALMLKAASHFGAHFSAAACSVLTHEMAWSGEEQEFAEWSAWIHERWGAVSAAYARLEITGEDRQDAVISRLLASAFAHHGDAVKWRAIATLPPRGFAHLHELFRTAEGESLAGREAEIVFDGVAIRATPESLYIRALLFDALCPGAFSRQEMEVADSWFLPWSRKLAVSDRPARDEAPVAIDSGGGGLVPDAGPAVVGRRYLAGMRGLREQAMDARTALHTGHLFPGTGCAAKLRIEHHVSALERLDDALGDWAGDGLRREARRKVADGGDRPGYVGIEEILGAGTTASGRRFVVTDVSVSGMGLSVPRSGDDSPVLGDVVGVQHDGALFVGRVVRRVVDPAADRLRVGVRLLARNPVPIQLAALGPRIPSAVRRVTGLFLPGEDSCGRHDAVLLPRAAFLARGPYEISLGGRSYSLRFNRDRVSGRGWSAARFEVMSARGR